MRIIRKTFPTDFSICDKHVYDPNIIANELNHYFANIGNNMANKLNHTNTTFQEYITRNSDQFIFKAVGESYVTQIILNLKSKSITGYDMILNKLAKLIGDELIKPLTLITNQILSGIFPDSLKIDKIYYLFKRDDPKQLSNYRPISFFKKY